MALALISAVLLIVLVLIAIRIGINRGQFSDDGEPLKQQTMHASGIYSIVRSTPRINIMSAKPDEEELIKYITSLNEDMQGNALSETDKSLLIEKWHASLEESITTVEKGDQKDVSFYYYDFIPSECPVCRRYFSKGKFMTREEIFLNPCLLPPLHLGCTCALLPHHGKENLRETTELGMLPLFKNQQPPPLPDWKNVLKPTI